MGPLHVKRNFSRPIDIGTDILSWRYVEMYYIKIQIRQAVSIIEIIYIIEYGGVIVGIDDCDCSDAS